MNFNSFWNLYVLSRNALITFLNINKFVIYIYKKTKNFIENAFNYLVNIKNNKAWNWDLI